MMVQGPMMVQQGMPGMMPGMQAFDEEGYRRQLMEERDAKDRERHRKGREVYKRLEEKRNMEQSSNCLYYMLAGDLLGAAIIAWAMCNLGWGSVTFTGTGVTNMHINTGMFDLEIMIICGKNWFEDQLCKIAQRMNGQDSINHFIGIATSMPGGGGKSEFERIQQASVVVMITYAWTLICLLISCVCGHFYWNTDHNPTWRSRSFAFGLLGPVSYLLGLAVWTMMMPDLATLPNTWLPAGFGNSALGYKAVQSPPYGSSFLTAVGGVLVLLVTNALASCTVQAHPDEIDDTEARMDRMEALDERLDLAKCGELPATYGATGMYTGGGGFGGQQDFGVYGGGAPTMMGGQMR